MHAPQTGRPGGDERNAADLVSRSLNDCWMMEAMPPTWTWAYSKLLTLGETRPGFDKRIG